VLSRTECIFSQVDLFAGVEEIVLSKFDIARSVACPRSRWTVCEGTRDGVE